MCWGCNMATISENLEALKTAKTSIKSAIEGKGQDLTDVPFTQYSEKIEAIQTKEDLDAELNEQDVLLADLQSAVDELPDKIDLSQTTATESDVREGKQFFNASGEKVTGTYVNKIPSIVDRTITILTKSDLDGATFISSSMFSGCKTLASVTLPKSITSIGGNAFFNCYALNIDLSECTALTSIDEKAFYSSGVTSIDLSKCTSLTSIGSQAFASSRLNSIIISSSVTSIGSTAFQLSSNLTDIYFEKGSYVTSWGYSWVYGCPKLTNLTLRNVVKSVEIGSGSSYGHLLTLDSLLNTIKELHTNTGTSTLKLTMGTANLAKLENVYVKLIDITDEMRAEDEYIDNKAPFVQCESTDEGAMLITEYVTTVKNWQLA